MKRVSGALRTLFNHLPRTLNDPLTASPPTCNFPACKTTMVGGRSAYDSKQFRCILWALLVVVAMIFNVGPVFHANYESTADIVVNQGGTDSGKTYAIMQLLFHYAIATPAPLVDPVITIVGESIPNLKKGAYRTAKTICATSPEIYHFIKDWNETDRTITFKGGWIMEFTSYKDEQSAKQGKRQYAFFNEANGIKDYKIFWQVAKRTRIRTFIDYNPTAPFWAHDNLIGTNPKTNDLTAVVQTIISDHRHNPFLTEKDHARTENIRDPEMWKVYARGITGNLIGLVYPNWTRIPDEQYPKEADFFGGLDFGYTNDPTAGVKIATIGESVFLHELCYTPGLAPIQTKEIFFANGFNEETEIFCEHDPDQISQLRRLGLMALPARKGQGSIKGGIKKMNEYKVFYTASSENLHEERKRYMYISDPTTGKPTNVPEDTFNHLLDASRYGVYTRFFRAA